jgi:alcohol dehydrogenase YqhD (iron-dependent ADH family)
MEEEMFDFIFHNPTKIIFGRDKELLIGDELAAKEIKKVIFVYGQESIKQSGLYDKVIKSLRDNDISFIKFGGVVSNPVLSHVREGILKAKIEQVEAVVAVGGGSVIDEAKAIAVGAREGRDIWEYYMGKEIGHALPVYTILTLAATGSEMNGNSVVTNEETQQKYNISSTLVYPVVSILNPELTFTVPANYSAYSAVDAIAHVIEAYFTKAPRATPELQDRLVEAIIKTVIETTDIILQEPDNYEARAQFMWASTLALNGLTPAGVGDYCFPNHMIEHSLSAIYNIAHGAGLGIVIPAWMKWYKSKNLGQFERFAHNIFGCKTAEEGIEALQNWFAVIKAPTRLSDVGIPEGDIDKIAENAAGLANLWQMGDSYQKETIAEILHLAV